MCEQGVDFVFNRPEQIDKFTEFWTCLLGRRLHCQLVSDRAWEGGFVFPRAQRCKQDGDSGF